MKKITIGRSHNCSVTITDNTDMVSRHHATIKCGFWGNMTIFDTSRNGTCVNDTPIVKPMGVKVTRRDTVTLGGSNVLDWSKVRDPYRKSRIALFSVIGCLTVLMGVGCCLYFAGIIPGQPTLEPIDIDAMTAVAQGAFI